MTLYFLRHTESVANAEDRLAGRMDFPLSPVGVADAGALAASFARHLQIDGIRCSPLLRARQTADALVSVCKAPLRIDERLIEQHMGRFAGLTYAQVEADPGYCRDRTARWDWVPDGGGESYREIAVRASSFLQDLLEEDETQSLLIVTHAVTLRLIRAVLENTLPRYPEKIASNGEVWMAELSVLGTAVEVRTIDLGLAPREYRA